MKKVLLFAVVALMLTACSNDEPSHNASDCELLHFTNSDFNLNFTEENGNEEYVIKLPATQTELNLSTCYDQKLWITEVAVYNQGDLQEIIDYDPSFYYENYSIDEYGMWNFGELTNYYPLENKYLKISHVPGEDMIFRIYENDLTSERKIVVKIIDTWFDYTGYAKINFIQAGK